MAQPETEALTRAIDGHLYEVKLLDAVSAVPVWHRVFKVLIPSLDAFSSSSGGLATVLEAVERGEVGLPQLAIVGKLATRVAAIAIEKMDPVDIRYCIDAFAGVTNLVTGGERNPTLKQVLPVHFAGRLASMAKWFAFCVEVNFGDFLGLAREMMSFARAQKLAQTAASAATATSASESPAASTG